MPGPIFSKAIRNSQWEVKWTPKHMRLNFNWQNATVHRTRFKVHTCQWNHSCWFQWAVGLVQARMPTQIQSFSYEEKGSSNWHQASATAGCLPVWGSCLGPLRQLLILYWPLFGWRRRCISPPSASLLCIFITDLEKSMLSLLPGGDWAVNLDVSSKQTKQRRREGAIAAKTKPASKIHMLIKCKTGWVCVYVSIHAQYWGFLSAAAIQLFPPVSDLVAESLEKSTSPIPWHNSPSLHNWVLALPPKAVLVRTLHL